MVFSYTSSFLAAAASANTQSGKGKGVTARAMKAYRKSGILQFKR
jgi:hypothetical protein